MRPITDIPAHLAACSIPEPNSGCLLWTKGLNRDGYAFVKVRGKVRGAHRLAWEMAHGPIPDGMCVCHKCDVPSCINPGHLFLDTQLGNIADMVAKRRHAKGTAKRSAKLTDEQALAIRADKRPQRTIAAEYGVDPSTVCRTRRQEQWGHI